MNCKECNTVFNYEDYLYNSSNNCRKCIAKNYPNVVKEFERLVKTDK